MHEPPKEFLNPRRQARFLAIQHCLVPRSLQFSAEQRRRSFQLVNNLLRDKSPATHFQLAFFLLLVDGISLAVSLRTFRRMPSKKQEQVMRWFFDSPLGILRKGFWGLNTLCKLSVYGQNSVYAEIGYVLKEVPQ